MGDGRLVPRSDAEPRAPHVLLAGGGSAGHVFPALAVGEVLRERGWKVSFAGTAQGMEARLVPAHGVDFHVLAAQPVVGRGLVAKVGSATTLLRSAFSGRQLIRQLGIDAVVGTGGYVSVPAVLGARLGGRPSILVEPNFEAGSANRFLSRFAAVAAVAAPSAARRLRCASEVTGVPVRRAFARPPQPLPTAYSVLVLGGSQGARSLNELLPSAFALAARRLGSLGSRGPLGSLGSLGPLTIVHQAGERFLEAARAAYAREGQLAAVVPFLDDVGAAMGNACLILSRAGANTLAEIACARRPAILLPLAAAAGHQAENATAVSVAGAGERFDEERGADALAETLVSWLSDRARLERAAEAAWALARPHAADAVADLVEREARR